MLYQVWLWKNNPIANAAYSKITPEQDKELDAVFSEEAKERYGMKFVLYCASAWANDEYRNWGITTFRSAEDHIAHLEAVNKTVWPQVSDLFSLLGTLEMDGAEPSLPPFPNPIYQLWMIRSNPAAYGNYARLSEEELSTMWAAHDESEKRTGAHMVLYCRSAWANEEYRGFGVTAFPSIEACQQNREDHEKLDWELYFSSFSILGTAI